MENRSRLIKRPGTCLGFGPFLFFSCICSLRQYTEKDCFVSKKGDQYGVYSDCKSYQRCAVGQYTACAVMLYRRLFYFTPPFCSIVKFKDGFKGIGGFRFKGKRLAKRMSSFSGVNNRHRSANGTGNIAGAATAVVSGGPGAIFWMWISAFFGMATIFSEATLAQKFKTTVHGEVTGGPVYYIKAAFNGRFGRVLAALFAIFIILALGFMGNMVQSNSISEAFDIAFGMPSWIVGVFVALLAGFIFMGGIRRIASVTEKLVPIMALLYIAGSLIVIGVNYQHIGQAFVSIFIGAFRPEAVLGGAAGISVKMAVRYGVSRGLFSNEAGMGSTPHAHALAKVDHPCDQGVVALMGVFLDTFVVLTLTALTFLTTGALSSGETGSKLAQVAFSSVFGHF
ncbi:MAG: alanine/glycine:cation symporter family protein, partial [Christensenellales bacterium]